jgi:hypothetical protein
MLYLLALTFPPIALLWCRRPWQALLNAVVLLGIVAWGPFAGPGNLLPALLVLGVLVWAVGAVARRGADGRATRRIHEHWNAGGHPLGPSGPLR